MPAASLDATAQAELVQRGDVSAVELVDDAIGRIQRTDTELNAVIIRCFEEARTAAASGDLPDGPFRGVPFLIKDLRAPMAGTPHHSGMRFLRDVGWVEPADSDLIRRFRAAGLLLLGRTNTPELGGGMTTEPISYGPTRNPWDTTRSTGGSSGGSAAAVAAGMVAAAHGSDGGGSIRIPASECGLVGLKVSRGRVSAREQGDLDLGLSVHGVLTRSVRDTAALLDFVAISQPGDPYVAPPLRRPLVECLGAEPARLRVGFVTQLRDAMAASDPECIAAVERTATLLADMGHAVEETHPAALEDGGLAANFGTVFAAGVLGQIDAWAARSGSTVTLDDVEPSTRVLAEMAHSSSAQQLLSAVRWLQDYTARMARWWANDGFDLLLTPTLTAPPPELGQLVTPDNPLTGLVRGAALVPFTPPFNVTGQPAVSLPMHWSGDGLPVGVQLVAAYGREDVLVSVAAQLEQASPWSNKQADLIVSWTGRSVSDGPVAGPRPQEG